MAALKLFVVSCLVAFISYAKSECDIQNEDPIKGIDTLESRYPYPEKDIEEALANYKGKALIEADAETNAKGHGLESDQTKVSIPYSTSKLCKSVYVTKKPIGWSYLHYNIHRCWILNLWWITPLSYATCPKQKCQNLNCFVQNYNCVPTNFKIYTAWSWCNNGGGFRKRRFWLPQCCECRKFNNC